MGKLQSSLFLSNSNRIREGHFVVIAAEGQEPKKFIIKLDHLNNPEFLKLLKEAEEEFGFSHEGALELPCRPDELQRILSI
ncbi:Auxin responsive SAUR protein [Corchorus capsularis]|uniref:Auxin responsive SAUR protein n=1 Tax=Corchorus capsularis TaxID=210143 RepID=A0A1R3HQK1_COCAP|nr:Auxin responsive SAUR protein [Corchorus capsularis]